MALTWTLTLKDAITGAASKATAALGRVRQALLGTKDAADKADAAMEKTFRDKNGKLRKSNGQFANEWVDLLKNVLGPRFSGLIDAAQKKWERYGNTIKSVGKGLAWIGGVAVGAAALMGLGIAKVIGQAEDFQSRKQKTLFAFDRLLGGPEEARKAWDMVRAASAKTKTSLSETAAAFNNLLAAGFTLPQTDTLFKQLADLKTLNPQANIDGIVRAIGQIKNTGKLQGDELMQLAEAGVNVSDVYDELQKKLGKTRDEILKLQQAGKIQAADAIEAVQKAISKRTGSDPGAVAGKAPKNLAETIAFAKDAFFDLLNLDFSPITDLIGRLSKGAGAEKFAGMITRVFNAITDPKTIGFLENFINNVGGSFFEGFADGFEAVANFFKEIDPGEMEDFAAVARSLGEVLGGLAAGLLFVSRAGATFMDWVGAFADVIGTILDPMSALGEGLGQAVTSGVVNGIVSGTSNVVASIVDMARSAIQAAEAELGIGSPSKVFDRIAGWTTQGYVGRIMRDAPRVQSAIANMFTRARSAGERFGGAMQAGASTNTTNYRTSSSTTKNVRTGDINIHQAPPTEEAIARVVRSQMRSMLATHG